MTHMGERHQLLLKAGEVLVEHLSPCQCVISVVCFGSVAMSSDDEMSDLDVFVFCDPLVMPDLQRREILLSIPRASDLQLGALSAAGFDNTWMAAQDKLRIADMPCDITYNTIAWMRQLMEHVRANGTEPLPELPFRPDKMLGLLDSCIVLFDRKGEIGDLKRLLRPYPRKLRTDIVSEGMSILSESLEDLHDYERRGIGNAAFAFHLNRMSDAVCRTLYALNELYDPATKRVEQSLKDLHKLPKDFMRRYEMILSQPLDEQGRHRVMEEYESLNRDLLALCKTEQISLASSDS